MARNSLVHVLITSGPGRPTVAGGNGFVVGGCAVPLNRRALLVDAKPRSVQEARRWVVQVCRDLGRTDVVECAGMGVSELVTNALLHARPPISVRVRGTRAHPRVEVSDGSPRPPLPVRVDLGSTDPVTFGRGLAMVGMCANAWGAELEDGGKVVWFEPAAEVGDEFAVPIISVPTAVETGPAPGPTVRVDLLGVPLDLLSSSRRQSQELRRELRLLSLARPADYPLAGEIGELFAGYERAVPQLGHQIAEARQRGLSAFDARLDLPASATTGIARLSEVLDVADGFCRSQRLLSLARTPEQAAFQRWLLGELVRQADGSPPSPWAAASAGADPAVARS